VSGKTIARADLIEAIHRRISRSRIKCSELLELVLKEITDCLERGETVKLSSFGSFVVRPVGAAIDLRAQGGWRSHRARAGTSLPRDSGPVADFGKPARFELSNSTQYLTRRSPLSFFRKSKIFMATPEGHALLAGRAPGCVGGLRAA
jgi:Bacterial DNA-binding protein